MKKILYLLPLIFILTIFSKDNVAFADSEHYCIIVRKFNDNQYEFFVYNCSSNSELQNYSDSQYLLTKCTLFADNNYIWYNTPDEAVSKAYEYIERLPSYNGSSNTYINKSAIYIITNGIINNIDSDDVFSSYDEYEDYINPPDPPEELTWYESLFNDFVNYIGAGLSYGIDGFINWLKDAWTVPVGEGEDDLAIDLITPPPPTPTPTPIPYQTVLQPDNNGGYVIQYIYNNPSGIPTSAPQPPNNTNINNNYGSNFEYPYYNNNTNKDDPYVLDIPWYLRFIFKGQTTSLSDFQDGIDATIETVNNSEEQINIVMDSMSIFPSEWLLMIGFIGAIPLVGGIISRLLKG